MATGENSFRPQEAEKCLLRGAAEEASGSADHEEYDSTGLTFYIPV